MIFINRIGRTRRQLTLTMENGLLRDRLINGCISDPNIADDSRLDQKIRKAVFLVYCFSHEPALFFNHYPVPSHTKNDLSHSFCNFLPEFDSHKGAADALSGSGQNLTICIIVRPNGTTCTPDTALLNVMEALTTESN